MSNRALMFVRKMGDKTILTTIIDSEMAEKLKTEHQHLCHISKGYGITVLSIFHDEKVDRTEEVHGCTIDNLLTAGIWQN